MNFFQRKFHRSLIVRRKDLHLFFAGLFSLWVTGCANQDIPRLILGPDQICVREGETPEMIAYRLGVPVRELLRVNRIKDPNQIRSGQILLVPLTQSRVQESPVRPDSSRNESFPLDEQPSEKIKDVLEAESQSAFIAEDDEESSLAKDQADLKPLPSPHPPQDLKNILNKEDEKKNTPRICFQPPTALKDLTWPLEIESSLKRGFSQDNPRYDGVCLASKVRGDVLSAHKGNVFYAGSLKSLGKAVVVKTSSLLTVYAYLEDTCVRKGDNVTRGMKLGRMGPLPKDTPLEETLYEKNHFYFEIREKTENGYASVDPEQYFALKGLKKTDAKYNQSG